MRSSNAGGPTSTRLPLAVAGCVVVGVGVGGVLAARVGADPYTLVVDGLAGSTGWPTGLALLTVGLTITLIAWASGRRPRAGLLLTIGLVAVVVDLFGRLGVRPDGLIARVVIFVVAVALIGAGIGAYRSAGPVEGPLDSLPQAMIDRGLPGKTVFIVVQLALLALGWMLGGDVGIGTVVAAIAIGPIALRVESSINATQVDSSVM